jgi:hypothetical protein
MSYDEKANLAIFGGRGAGRTTCALFMAIRHCEIHGHGAHVIFIRQMLRSLREVEDNLHMMLIAQYGASAVRVNRQDHMFVLPGGGTIEFSPINDTEDMAKIQGRSFSLVIADEYGNFSPQQMKFVDQIRASLRAGNIPCRFVLLANPGGRGHQAIKGRFIDCMVPGMFGIMDDSQVWVLLPATFRDNPHNPADYIDSLFASSGRDKELLRAWTDGAWNIARGAMFADIIDEERQRFQSKALLDLLEAEGRDGVYGFLAGDWGQSAPAVCFACLKFLKPRWSFPRGSLVLIDEVSSSHPDDRSAGQNWSIGRFADAVSDMCERTGVNRLGTMDDQKGLQPEDTLIKGLAMYNFGFTRPMKNRRSGWAAMRELLFNSHSRNGKAGQWVADKCAGWWETVPVLPRDPINAEDVDSKAIDHWADANRYGAVYEVCEFKFNNAAESAKKFPTSAGPVAPTIY